MRRVVITGIGPVTAGAMGKEAFWDSLLAKRMVVSGVPPEFEKTYHYKSRFFVPKPELPAINSGNMMEEMSKIAVVAARLAISDAGLDNCTGVGVMIGVGIGSLTTGFESYCGHIGGGQRFHRLVIPMLMPNAAAAWVSIDRQANGLCHTVNAACASGSVAIGEAFLRIQNGGIDRMITGGVECLDDGMGAVMRGFDALTALTTAPDGLPRPFSKNRSGFLFNMGAGCLLVLEELEAARKRGAAVYAEITGYWQNCDAHHIVQMSPDSRQMIQLLEPLRGTDIDYINAHGTATPQNDELEAGVLRHVFGKRQPLTNSTKGLLGHSIGASGALEAAVAALSIENQTVHGNMTDTMMEGLNLPLDAVQANIRQAVSLSFGFGGHNALLLFRRYPYE